MKFQSLNAFAHTFPKPKLSTLPLFDLRYLGLPSRNSFSDDKKIAFFCRDGRSALAHALQLTGHSGQNSVLLPAYHCGTIIEPAIWLGTNIYLYHVNKDLSPDLDHIAQLISQTEKPIKSLLIVHYFGFHQSLDKINLLCQKHGITLIEDCAHAYYRPVRKVDILRGDLTIASPRKFFPIPDGGILTVNKPELLKEIQFQQRSIKAELKSLYRCLHSASLYLKPGVLGHCFRIIDNLRAKKPPAQPGNPTADAPSTPNSLQWFEPEKIGIRGSLVSKLLMHLSAHEQIKVRRQQNYHYLYQATSKFTQAYPLYKPDSTTIPYMLPLIITNPDHQFTELKKLGVPIWRWEELAESDCENSQHYRTHLLHIPCHQSLTTEDLDWIISQLSKLLA